MSSPLVTVGIANFNGGRFLEIAIASALGQDLREIEVIVVDDGSDDDSVARAVRWAKRDPRVRVERLPNRRGPGGARNRAMDLARGEWFAILDSDDLMHPARLSRLLARAEADGADIVADDLLVFEDASPGKARRFLGRGRSRTPTWLTAEEFVLETRLLRSRSDLGYLKPMIRLRAWRASKVRYDETMPIGEDHDLLFRLLAAGLACRIDPFLGYFYRKHAASVSHRLSAEALSEIVRAHRGHLAAAPPGRAPLLAALARREASIATAQAFVEAVAALKRGRFRRTARVLAGRPQAALLLRMPAVAAARRLWARMSRSPKPVQPSGKQVWFVCRQRVVGRTNGSSTYLLDLAEAVRRAGFTPRLLQPSPSTLGRWPIMWLKPAVRVFGSIRFRGVFRLGPLMVARDPGVWLAAARGAAAKVLAKLGLPSAWLNARPAPYAPAAEWLDDDFLFVARCIRGQADILVADYAWQTEALAYALRPDASTAVVMHDLFHRRMEVFREPEAPAAVARLDRDAELLLLGRADAVIAIQKTEADEVAGWLPHRRVLVVPMTAEPASTPHPGDASRILFVGSNTGANVSGLTWMLTQVWPALRAAFPGLEFLIAGSVSRAHLPSAEGVRYLGFVERLDELYRTAGVVVSPLIAGSGLKIKLIEALSYGKACVATSITLQGVEQETSHAVAVADTPEAFASAVIRLLTDEPSRTALGARALAAIRSSFTADARHGEFIDWLRDPGSPAPPPAQAPAEPSRAEAAA
ncbi:MAG: glycosyltransferase [Caulobacteraceae bacterium]|nr:glycosyltransferase [Caulobacteraceae bacterium]